MRTAFFDGTIKVHNGSIIAVKTHVAFSGLDYVRAFRSLRAQAWFSWSGHDPAGGETYDLTETGRQEAEKIARPPKPASPR